LSFKKVFKTFYLIGDLAEQITFARQLFDSFLVSFRLFLACV